MKLPQLLAMKPRSHARLRTLKPSRSVQPARNWRKNARLEIRQTADAIEGSVGALQLRLARADVALTAIADGVLTVDSEGAVVYANPVVIRLFQLDATDLLGHNLREHLPDQILAMFDDLARGGPSSKQIELKRLKPQDDQPPIIDCNWVPIVEALGVAVGYTLVCRDVSDQHRLDLQLRAELESRRAALDALHRVLGEMREDGSAHASAGDDILEVTRMIGDLGREKAQSMMLLEQTARELGVQKLALDEHAIVSITDAAGSITYANQKFTEISGYSNEELLGQNHRLLKSGLHTKQFYQDLWATIAAGKVWNGQIANRKRGGGIYWTKSTIVPWPDKNGVPCQYVVTRTDITPVKEAEEKLRQAEALLRSAIQTIDEAFVIYDPDDRLVYCNDKYRQIYASVADLMVPGVRFETLIRAGAESGQYADAIGRVDDWVGERMAAHLAADTMLIQRHSDGRVVRIIERQTPEGYIVGFRVDVTELDQAKAAAQAANIAKSQFLATMSHEIRTPMNGILGMAQVLLTPDIGETDRLSYARTLLASGQALMSLLNNILDLSKAEANKFELESRAFEPGQIIRETQTLFAATAGNKGLRLESAWSGPPRQYLGDPHRLQQMLSNLVSNAIKFTAQGQIRIEAREIECAEQLAVLEFVVTDSGAGIPEDKRALLFERFSQADATIARSHGGSGLGLAIVRNLARLMGGQADVKSEVGRGSRFWFRIPARLAAAETGKAVPGEGLTTVADAAAAITMSERTKKPANILQIRPLVDEILPLIKSNKYNALSRFQSLQEILAGTEAAPEIAAVSELLNAFRFDQAHDRLRQIAAASGWEETPDD